MIKFFAGVAVGVIFHRSINSAINSFLNPSLKNGF